MTEAAYPLSTPTPSQASLTTAPSPTLRAGNGNTQQTQAPTTVGQKAQEASSSATASTGASSPELGIGIGVGAVVLVIIGVGVALLSRRSGSRPQTVTALLKAARADSLRPSTGRDSSFMHHDVYNPAFNSTLEMASHRPSSRRLSSQHPTSRLHHPSQSS